MPYRVMRAADDDLDTQASYFARKAGTEIALRFYEAAAATFASITRMPEIGERHESPDPRLRVLRIWRVEGFENHLVFYTQEPGGIVIRRVLHGARDLHTILDEDQSDPDLADERAG